MDEKHERQLQLQRDWYQRLGEEEREKRRAKQREYRRQRRLLAKDEVNAYKRENRAKNREKVNEQQREYYAEHKDQFAEYRQRRLEKAPDFEREAKRVAYAADPEAARKKSRARRAKNPRTAEWHDRQAFFKEYPSARPAYWRHGRGLGWDAFKSIYLRARTGPCDICKRNDNWGRKRFYLDHSHADGTYRGVLCQRCNSALGLFGDDPRLLMNAIAYLSRGETTG